MGLKQPRSFSQAAAELPVRPEPDTASAQPVAHRSWSLPCTNGESSRTDLLRKILQPRLLQSNSAPKLNKEPGAEGKNWAAHPNPAKMMTLLLKQLCHSFPGASGWTARTSHSQGCRLGSHRSSSGKGLTLSCSLCSKGKKPNTNEWETGKGLNPVWPQRCLL